MTLDDSPVSASAPPSSRHRAGWIVPLWTRFLRPFAAGTLLLLGWETCRPWEIALAMELPDPPRPSRLEGATRAFESGLRALERATRLGRQAGVEAIWEDLEAADLLLREEFTRVGRELESAAVPEEIRARQRDAETRYRANFAELRHLGDQLLTAGGEASGLRAFLAERGSRNRHQPLDPAHLPHRLAEPNRRLPRMSAEGFALPIPARQPGDKVVPVAGLASRAAPPSPADLAPTVEAPHSAEILELAASLDHQPLKLYEWVRNQIDATPSYGSIQGAAGCLRTRLCNAFDSASLLVALLRVSGVPARWGLGTIEVPIDTVRDWAGGFDSGEAALSFLAASGTPAVGLTSGEQLTAVRMEHVWVEAFLDFLPSRGATSSAVGDTWVPLDPSFKRFTYQGGIDLAAATQVDAVATFTGLVEEATLADPDGGVVGINFATMSARLAEARQQIRTYLDARPELSSLSAIVGGRQVIPQALGVLAGSLPYRVLVRAGAVAQLPVALSHRLTVEVFENDSALGEPGLSFEAPLAAISSRKLTLSWAPASPADEAFLVSLLPAGGDPAGLPTTLPAYLIRVRPELRLEGAVAAAGSATTLGEASLVRMRLHSPDGDSQVVDNSLTAGSYSALVLDLGKPESAAPRVTRVEAIRARIAAGDFAGLTKDEVIGELVYSAGLLYWSELDLVSRMAARQQGVVRARLPSQGFFTYDLAVSTVFGVPVAVRAGAMTTDVDTNVQAVVARDGNPQPPLDYLAVGGALASRAEATIWDTLLRPQPTGEGVSAMSYLEAAARQGIPIYHLDASNLQQALGDLDVPQVIKADIAAAVAAGREVTIPQRQLVKDGFFGTGYVVFDPETGAAGYFISGGLAGGGAQLPPIHPLITYLVGLVLVALGIFASGFPAVILAALTVAVIGYDTIATVQGLDPNLSPEAREFVINFLEGLAMIGALLAVVGVFAGSVVAYVAFAVFWSFLSLIAGNLLVSLAASGNWEQPPPPEPISSPRRKKLASVKRPDERPHAITANVTTALATSVSPW